MRKHVIFLLLISFLVVSMWFRFGSLLAGGEEGFSIFSSVDWLEQISPWQRTGTGYLAPHYLTRLFPVIYSKFLGLFSIPLFLRQASMFFLLIASGTIGMYLLARELLTGYSQNSPIYLIGSLFYFLNLYTLTQVFGRFLYSGMFLWSYLPIFLFLWIKWITSGNKKYLLLISVSSFVFSLTFLQVAHIFTLFIPIVIWTGIEIFRHKKNLFKLIQLTLVSIFVILISNLWWIYPYLNIGESGFTGVVNWKLNLDSLVSVSQYFKSLDIFLLRQSFLLGSGSNFFEFYSQKWIYGLSIFASVVVVTGIIFSKKKRNWNYLLLLLGVGWFLSKGANPPFGLIFYKTLFVNINFAQALRNPYEKLGLIWVLPYSLFFSVGLFHLQNKLKKPARFLFSLLVVIFLCGVLVWPLWSGIVFDETRIRIPDYYEEAENFLKSKDSNGRILMLPIIPGDAVSYNWGYRGVEPGEFLFNTSSISKIVRSPYFDSKYFDLRRNFTMGSDYNKLLEEMNISYLILHGDINVVDSGVESPQEVEKVLGENQNIILVKKIGELKIYEYVKFENAGLFNELAYQKITPTHYKVKIVNANDPFELISKVTYDRRWQARIGEEKIIKHSLVYGYANSWRVERKGDYTIDVVFKVWPWE